MAPVPFRLFLLRHAHSSWALPGQRDHQRPLDDRGREDAARLADAIRQEAIELDCIHCSTATRARETLEIVEAAFARTREIRMTDDLYALGTDAYGAAMTALPEARTILLVGHNPTIEDFTVSLLANDQTAKARLGEGLPTCGLVEIGDGTGWESMRDGGGTLRRLLVPRDLR